MNSAFVLCEELCRSRRICTILHILLSLKAKTFLGNWNLPVHPLRTLALLN